MGKVEELHLLHNQGGLVAVELLDHLPAHPELNQHNHNQQELSIMVIPEVPQLLLVGHIHQVAAAARAEPEKLQVMLPMVA